MAFDFNTLITNRTQADVDRVRYLAQRISAGTSTPEERAEWNTATLKGAYNYTDLNRATEAMEELDRHLRELGYESGYKPVLVHYTIPDSRLPSGYIELESIGCNGSQYFDTGIKPNQDTRVVCKVDFPVQSGAAWLFGVRKSLSEQIYGFLTVGSEYRSDFGNTFASEMIPSFGNPLFLLDKSGNKTLIDDKPVQSAEYSRFQCEYSLALFANSNAGSITGKCTAEMQFCQIYQDGANLSRNYVPCKDPSGVVGLYDLVSASFNRGNGVFIPGKEVSFKPIPDPENAYRWLKEDIPTITQLQQYISNVSSIRSAFDGVQNAPSAPTSPRKLNTDAANNIEKLLAWVENTINILAKTLVPCGPAICGGDYL